MGNLEHLTAQKTTWIYVLYSRDTVCVHLGSSSCCQVWNSYLINSHFFSCLYFLAKSLSWQKKQEDAPPIYMHMCISSLGIPDAASDKEPACQCRKHNRHGFSPWVGKILWRRAWQPTLTFLWRISWTEEPGGLQSVGSQRVRHDWSDLTCLRESFHYMRDL